MKLYIATIQVAIEVANEAEAADYVSETMRDRFFDWQYLQVGGQFLSATEKYVLENYTEGQAFK